MNRLIIAILLISWSSTLADENEVMIATRQGKLLGLKQKTSNDVTFYAFTNIPYAKPPLGQLRFKPPEELSNWKGIRITTFSPMCYQWLMLNGVSNFFGVEDCLYLNVFTPTINEKANLPIVVCIHGGEFQRGSSYDCVANNFVEKNIVFVSINYRLGVLGFLSAGDQYLPGNNGLKDQVAALKWVRKHISSYGGNPNKITVLGHNAGAVSVHLHMYSDLSKDLFHLAISQSGTALVPWSVIPLEVAKNRTNALSNLINCPNASTIEMLNCLRKVQAKNLVELQPKLFLWEHEPFIIFSPVIEPDVENAFLTRDPWKTEEIFTVPWILGYNSGEGILKTSTFFNKNKKFLQKFNEDLEYAFPLSLLYRDTATKEQLSEITTTLKNYYFKDKSIGVETIRELIKLMGDGLINYGTIKAALKYKNTKYFYLFDHQIKYSFSKIFQAASGLKDINMVSHGDDFVILFNTPLEPNSMKEVERDIVVANRMLNYWTNFIKTGNPNDDEISLWEPIEDEFKYLHITTETDHMATNLMEDTYHLWDSLPLRSKQDESETIPVQTASNVIDEL